LESTITQETTFSEIRVGYEIASKKGEKWAHMDVDDVKFVTSIPLGNSAIDAAV
jgi:pentose-5-phosphate-3-epimerase